MKNISIETPDRDLEIKYGMYDLTRGAEPSPLALSSFKYIGTDISDIKTRYIRLGFHLAECKKCKYYEHFGYMTLEEFTDANFGFDKSAVSRCINVFERFCQRGGSYGNTPTMFIDKKYEDYSYSQLCEMLPLSEDDIRLIKPSMSVSAIREIKKKNKKVKQVATSQPEGRLCVNDLVSKKGIVLQNCIKNAVEINTLHFSLFDENGKRLINDFACDVLLSGDNSIVLRAVPDNIYPGNSERLKFAG